MVVIWLSVVAPYIQQFQFPKSTKEMKEIFLLFKKNFNLDEKEKVSKIKQNFSEIWILRYFATFVQWALKAHLHVSPVLH